MTPEALRERARAILDAEYYPEADDTPQRLENALVVAFTALVAEARAEECAKADLQHDLLSTMPGRRCVRPDHNGGEGSEGRIYGYMCGGCAFELAQEEADMARREQIEMDAKIAEAGYGSLTGLAIAAALRTQEPTP